MVDGFAGPIVLGDKPTVAAEDGLAVLAIVLAAYQSGAEGRPITLAGGQARAAMKIAVFTVSLPEWTPEEAVRNLAELGYDGVEWRIADDPPRATPGFWQGNRCTFPLSTFVEDAPRIRALTEAAGLAIPAIASYVQAADLENVERVFRGAAALGTGGRRRWRAFRSHTTTASPGMLGCGSERGGTTGRSRAWRAPTG